MLEAGQFSTPMVGQFSMPVDILPLFTRDTYRLKRSGITKRGAEPL